jgi:hypothetical protein
MKNQWQDMGEATKALSSLLSISIQRGWIAGGESGLDTKSPLVRDVFNVYRPWPSSRNPAAETAHVRTNPCAGSGCEDSHTCDWVGRTHSGRHL